jgi:hypothetical protein
VTLAQIVFEKRKLEKRYDVEGRVAGHYVEAGYHVTMGFATPKGPVSFVAKKGGQLLAVDVIKDPVRVTADMVNAVAEKAASIRAKPVLVLYGAGPVLTEEAKKAAAEKGVAVRRLRG